MSKAEYITSPRSKNGCLEFLLTPFPARLRPQILCFLFGTKYIAVETPQNSIQHILTNMGESMPLNTLEYADGLLHRKKAIFLNEKTEKAQMLEEIQVSKAHFENMVAQLKVEFDDHMENELVVGVFNEVFTNYYVHINGRHTDMRGYASLYKKEGFEKECMSNFYLHHSTSNFKFFYTLRRGLQVPCSLEVQVNFSELNVVMIECQFKLGKDCLLKHNKTIANDLNNVPIEVLKDTTDILIAKIAENVRYIR